jgi:formylglycine-generating enzyme
MPYKLSLLFVLLCLTKLATAQKPNDEEYNMVLVRGGTFRMGSESGDNDEKPVHEVSLSDFYLGKYEVTVKEFRQFIETSGYLTDAEKEGKSSGYDGTEWTEIAGRNWRHSPDGKIAPDNHPVINVSWNDAISYCKWLAKITGKKYRLPTEAEWEYAAGNGLKHTKYSWGNDAPVEKKSGNVVDETGKAQFPDWITFEGYTDGFVFNAPVGSFEPNTLGLYDLSGNVWEWCSDWKGPYSADKQSNPVGPRLGYYRVIRGGSWGSDPQYCQVAFRSGYGPGVRDYSFGFRLAKTP